LAPEWKALASVLAGSPISVAKVDCVTEPNTCAKTGVGAYPTLILFNSGKA